MEVQEELEAYSGDIYYHSILYADMKVSKRKSNDSSSFPGFHEGL